MIETASPRTNKASLNFDWLIKLRWGALISQAVAVLLIYFVWNVDLPLLPIFTTLACELLINNIALGVRNSTLTISEKWVVAFVLFDLAIITSILFFTGGPTNPFSVIYLVHIALASAVLSSTWAWLIATIAIGLYGILFIFHVPLPMEVSMSGHAHGMDWHLQGMWLAFTIAALSTVYFVTRITEALTQREKQLADFHDRANKAERLLSLTTLTAGAAHELANPLATIAVVANELEQELRKIPGAHDAVGDAKLIRSQVEDCKVVLNEMAADAGQNKGEPCITTLVERFIHDVLSGLKEPQAKIELVIENEVAHARFQVYRASLSRVLRNILNNAVEASGPNKPVTLQIEKNENHLLFHVMDQGEGMDEKTAKRAEDPFFTTKETHSGMGLGLFLARSVLDQIDGSLKIESKKGEGTTVTVQVPWIDPPMQQLLLPE